MNFALLGFIAANVLAAMSGAVWKPGAWYEGLDKPWWRPPNWAFPVVWTLLYACIATAGWLVWSAVGGWSVALTLYAAQLGLNAVWSYLFFGRKRPDWAIVEMGCMWLAIAATILAFAPISVPAALLMAPYLLWVSVAFMLNLSILRLNRRDWAAEEGRA